MKKKECVKDSRGGSCTDDEDCPNGTDVLINHLVAAGVISLFYFSH